MAIDFSAATEYLTSARNVIVRSVLFLLVSAAAAYVFSDIVLTELLGKMPMDSAGLVFLSPTEAFVTRLKLAIAGGLIPTVPFLLFQVWSAAKSFMDRRLARITFWLIPLAFGLFLAGAAFGYFVLLPIALQFLLGFRGPELEPMLAIGPFVGFVLLLVLPLGLIFQMPIVAVFLTRLGILDPRAAAGRRKYAILVIFIVSALLTPPDVFSQLLMAAPLLVLFELSLLVARLAAPRRE